MYPTAYQWISAPTPVTTSVIVIESGSTRTVASNVKPPDPIHSKSRTAWRRSSPGDERSSRSTRTPRPNPAATRIVASQPAHLPSRRPTNRLTAAPASGSVGMSQAWSIIRSSPQHAHVVDARALPPPIDVHDDRQADHDLGRGDHHGEERKDLPVQVAVHPTERDEREVHAVQLELDGHEDDQRVLPDEHADGPDREQHRGDDQEVRDRRPHVVSSDVVSDPARVTARRGREARTMT